MKRNLILTMLIGLILGVVIGFFSAGTLARHRIDKLRRLGKDPKAEQDRIVNLLELTDDQKKVIIPILEEEIPKQRKEFRQHRMLLDSMREEMFERIEKELSVDQRFKLEKLKKKGRRRGPH